ncbi:MAG: LytTR family transcriptional regulator [Runella slithyformis]|nr:MAG: LytTR family transcriptional regulator [Runella slithyformis]TAE90396.1 MAG: LytTR family transcriptional regulator [Runella slithyformis]TAF29816.1 MAG: LytTR family transcriptional regulator [Runella slithyformis]TAF48833.1 MAG: LytTR family transcriptional regulator [Runella slithyformis]TAF83416.1 MAG: LytTR family transcriptional regulator [Runella slithyformis]
MFVVSMQTQKLNSCTVMNSQLLANPFAQAPLLALPSETLHRIVISYGGRQIVIPTDQLTHLEAEGNYTFLCTRDGRRYLMSKTLKSYGAMLDERCFVRVHKSTIVNVNYLTEVGIDPDRFIKLESGKVIAVSRRKVKDLQLVLSPFMRIV